jgi:hypothetical protein
MDTSERAGHPPTPAPGPKGHLAAKNLGARFSRFKRPLGPKLKKIIAYFQLFTPFSAGKWIIRPQTAA